MQLKYKWIEREKTHELLMVLFGWGAVSNF